MKHGAFICGQDDFCRFDLLELMRHAGMQICLPPSSNSWMMKIVACCTSPLILTLLQTGTEWGQHVPDSTPQTPNPEPQTLSPKAKTLEQSIRLPSEPAAWIMSQGQHPIRRHSMLKLGFSVETLGWGV